VSQRSASLLLRGRKSFTFLTTEDRVLNAVFLFLSRISSLASEGFLETWRNRVEIELPIMSLRKDVLHRPTKAAVAESL
jgi:hypothetical protein